MSCKEEGPKALQNRHNIEENAACFLSGRRGAIGSATEQDWDRDIEAVAVSEDGNTSTFELEADQPFIYFKPCLVRGGEFHWAVGSNNLLLARRQLRSDDEYDNGPYLSRVEIRS